MEGMDSIHPFLALRDTFEVDSHKTRVPPFTAAVPFKMKSKSPSLTLHGDHGGEI